MLQTLNRYPDPQAKVLKRLLAGQLNVSPENILTGNGSDELIYYLITTFGGPVLYPVPTFSMYGIISQALGERKVEIPLDDRFDIDISKTVAAMKRYKPKLVFLSSPNNPTGNSFSSEKVLRIIAAASSRRTPIAERSIVVIDEAYQPFSGRNEYVPLLTKYNNLIIMRTLSKIGLAALRLGFMAAGRGIIAEVNKVRLPFNVNSLSQKIAADALKNNRQMQRDIKAIVSERKSLFREMTKMNFVTPYPSDANFILFHVPNAGRTFKELLKKGVLVRDMTGVLSNCLRVTVGTPEENSIFLKNLKRSL